MQSSFQGFPTPKPNKGGTNTGDATATAGDLGSGSTAYGKFGKLVGTGANFGNAAVGDVSNGKTFSSANGTLIAGTGANVKSYASGSIASGAGPLSFTTDGGTTSSPFPLTVPFASIGFIPAYIEFTGGIDKGIYTEITGAMGTNAATQIAQGSTLWRLTGNAYVNGTGFQFPTGAASGTVYTWKAWSP